MDAEAPRSSMRNVPSWKARRPGRTSVAAAAGAVALLLAACGADEGTADTPVSPGGASTSAPTEHGAPAEPIVTEDADAAPLTATWTDDPYDGTSGAQQELIGGAASYDTQSGAITFSSTFAEAPGGQSFETYLILVLGRSQQEDRCTEDFSFIASTGSDSVSQWNMITNGVLEETGSAIRSTDGATLTLSVEDVRFADAGFTCAQAFLVDEDTVQGLEDYTYDRSEPATLRSAPEEQPSQPESGQPEAAPPGVGPTTLAGNYFWAFRSTFDTGWDNTGVFFVDDSWAVQGIPEGGLVTGCATTTGSGEIYGSGFTSGCVPYTYDVASGVIEVGANTGTFSNGVLTLGSTRFMPLAVPQPGTRLAVELLHQGSFGCGVMPGCTTWTEVLILTEDGQFVKSRTTQATAGGGGRPFTSVSAYPEDERGTYEILSDGRIRLSFSDGTVRTSTIGIEVDDRGDRDPQGEGLLLDGVNYYP